MKVQEKRIFLYIYVDKTKSTVSPQAIGNSKNFTPSALLLARFMQKHTHRITENQFAPFPDCNLMNNTRIYFLEHNPLLH